MRAKDVILGVRPEHTTVCFDKRPNSIESTISVNEMMGSELHLHVHTSTDDKLIVRIPTVSLDDEQRHQMAYGKPLNITFEGKVMHFFDPETEKNLLA